ncbi:MAG: sulfatase-like hydrolase/transferase [Xanthobacteraceae bacterium]
MRAALLSLSKRFGQANFFATRFRGSAMLLVLPQLVALGIMLATENNSISIAGYLLGWGLLNFLLLAFIRRPAVAGLVALILVTLLVLLSQLKYDVMWMTANFVDVMIVDTDTIAFLFTIFPDLRWFAALGAVVLIPLVALAWRYDPFRVRRPAALILALVCLVGLTILEKALPLVPYQAFYGGNEFSSFARSGVDAVSALMTQGLMESDPNVTGSLPPAAACRPAKKPPHIILIHDESSFDIRRAPDVDVPEGYGAHFLSFDGKERNFIVEGNGGPSWYTEYNVLDGLAARTFGAFSYFVTRIAAGRVKRGLPAALERCGYRTYTLYPAYGAFLSEKSFEASAGVKFFFDKDDLNASGIEPDSFFYDAALKLFREQHATGPMFVYVYLEANHLPWNPDHPFRPDLTPPQWKDPGNDDVEVDEYLRRQAMSAHDYAQFLEKLKREFPDDSFLLVRYGDHQPYFSTEIIEPDLSNADIQRRLMTHDPRYFTTYYAIDAVNFKPVDVSTALDTLEGPYLPLVTLEAAGLPLDPSFAAQKRILLRCHGLFYGCDDGATARRFNRLLIDSGLIQHL